jgi:hypothetical protein
VWDGGIEDALYVTMDTYEARLLMRDLAHQGLELIDRFRAGTAPRAEDKRRLRELVLQARGALADAGYPAEACWRGLQRASIGAETLLDGADGAYWENVAEELRDGIETLNALVSPTFRRESDFHIVG